MIRPLDPDEVRTLVDDLWFPLAREMAELNEADALADDAREKALSYRRERLADDDVHTLVAEADRNGPTTDDATTNDGEAGAGNGDLVGFVSGKRHSPSPVFRRGPELYVDELFVREEARREGIASELMERIEAWGRQQDCERVTLTVTAGNDAALALYERRGYEIERHRLRKPLE